MAKNLQLFRNKIDNLPSTKDEAKEMLIGQLETSSDGEMVLARYDNNGAIETIFGIAASGESNSGYTIFESAKEVSIGSDDVTRNFLENEGENGEQVLAVREITTDVTRTSADIQVVGLDGVLGAGYKNGDVISAGTSIEEILVKLLSKELYPSVATKPSIDINGEKVFSVVEVYSSVTIPAVTMTTNVGKFNASYSNVSQPSVEGVTFSEQSMSATVTGFNGLTIASGTDSLASTAATVSLGANEVVYSASATYSAPSNLPITNLSKETSKTGETAADGTAIWTSAAATKTVKTTAVGVYPCFTNISGGALIADAISKLGLTSGNTFTLTNVPSEVTSNQVFMFDFPSNHSIVSFQAKDPSGNFVDFAAAYTLDTVVTKNLNGTEVSYNRLMTTTPSQGIATYKITLNKGLNQ